MSKKVDSYIYSLDDCPVSSRPSYLLRRIPSDLWLSARVKSTRKGVSMRLVILKLLRYWLDEKVDL